MRDIETLAPFDNDLFGTIIFFCFLDSNVIKLCFIRMNEKAIFTINLL